MLCGGNIPPTNVHIFATNSEGESKTLKSITLNNKNRTNDSTLYSPKMFTHWIYRSCIVGVI